MTTHTAGRAGILSAGTLIGDKVRNNQGETLGKLIEIMFDTNTGQISYGVLSFGGIAGLGDKLFAVPWSAMEVDFQNHCLVFDVDKERLKEAPGFDKDDWPDMADPTWGENIHTYYNRPYSRSFNA